MTVVTDQESLLKTLVVDWIKRRFNQPENFIALIPRLALTRYCLIRFSTGNNANPGNNESNY